MSDGHQLQPRRPEQPDAAAGQLRLRPPQRPDAAAGRADGDVRDGLRQPPSTTRPRATPQTAGADGRRPRNTATQLRRLLASPRGLRQAVLAAEVLGPGRAVRRGQRRR